MKVYIKISGFSGIRSANQTICLKSGDRIRDILETFSNQNEMFRSGLEKNHIVIMKNGVSIEYLQGTDTELNDGDELLIAPMLFGG